MPGLNGRRPKPSSLKELQGNPGRRPRRKGEPRPDPGRPPMPDYLSEIAKGEWNRLADLLEGIKVLTVVDGPALEATATAYDQYRTFQKIVSIDGPTYQVETKTGGTMTRARPEVIMQSDAWRRYVAGLSHFGLTPATRSKVSVRKEKAEKAKDNLFRFKRDDAA